MFEGLRAVAGGITFELATPRVWLYAAVPAVVLVILACGLAGVGLYVAGAATHTLLGDPETIWGHVGGWLLWTLLMLGAVLVAMLLALVLAQPLSGFALEAIALAQE